MSATSTLLGQGLWTNNPILVQVLGICSTLAVTNNMRNTLIMTLGVTFATAFSSWNFSLMKEFTPRKVRLILQVLIISFYVIIIDIALKAFLPDISKQLGPYVGLIITNCILQGRQEAFGAANKPWPSFVDGLANGLGYMAVLMTFAFFRELLGFGSVFGFRVMGEGFVPWTIMIMAPSGFFIVGFAIWITHGLRSRGGTPAVAATAVAAGTGGTK
ncbi:MAG: Rnf-Nqr domain containing protein [Spirochaetota bacterium]